MESITISRDGQQYGPYTLEQVNGYLVTGNLVPSDLAWNAQTSVWVPLASLPGIQFTAPPPPVPRQRNAVVLVLMAVVWWLAIFFFSFIVACFLAGMVVGIMHPGDLQAGLEARRTIPSLLGLPLLFVTLGLSIWLTVIGKLPGTRK
ncbi:MAG: DUF4339 domain-containing protein [Methylacidiphilales bacterium]|nr:DUF4339 domain-containing protein [Candidatus Methylacidiphilales bacterium]